MMAKMFYTLEEAKAALGRSEDDIKTFAREGRLREFRDGPRLMFKADQVEQLKSELSGGDQVDLGVSDSGGLIGLVDTTGASGTSITLADTGHGTGVGMPAKEDTALAADLGLSGSMGGLPSPTRAGPSGTGLSGTAHGSRQGINVFGTEEVGVDPSAQTAITGGVREQLNLESVGSGSGLLDLTRESDDTSLGAVLDEINPGATRAARANVEIGDAGLDLDEPTGGVTRTASVPVYVEAPDSLAPAFGAASLGAGLMLLFAVYAVLSGVLGAHANAVKWFDGRGWWMPAAIGLGITAVFFVFGLLLGRGTSGRRV